MSKILDYIGIGRDNAVPRKELARRMDLPDRTVRNMIEEARRQGHLIINDQTGAGYYIGCDLEELKRQHKTNHRRAMSILVQQKHLRRRIKELEEQQ